jgi:hypothetical protein
MGSQLTGDSDSGELGLSVSNYQKYQTSVPPSIGVFAFQSAAVQSPLLPRINGVIAKDAVICDESSRSGAGNEMHEVVVLRVFSLPRHTG